MTYIDRLVVEVTSRSALTYMSCRSCLSTHPSWLSHQVTYHLRSCLLSGSSVTWLSFFLVVKEVEVGRVCQERRMPASIPPTSHPFSIDTNRMQRSWTRMTIWTSSWQGRSQIPSNATRSYCSSSPFRGTPVNPPVSAVAGLRPKAIIKLIALSLVWLVTFYPMLSYTQWWYDLILQHIFFFFDRMSIILPEGSKESHSTVFFTFQFYKFPHITTERLLLGKPEHQLTADRSAQPCVLRRLTPEGSMKDGPAGYQVLST